MPTQTLSLDTVFEDFIAGFADVFSKPQLAHFRVYLLGLILYVGVHWLSRLHESVGHSKDYTTFTRFVSEAPWSHHELEVEWRGYLNRHARRVLASLRRRAKGKEVPVYLLIDDTLNPKRGKRMDWVGRHYSHSEKQVVNGHCMVSAMLVIGDLILPWAFALYKKKIDCLETGVAFYSKLDLAAKIVRQYQPLPETKVYVLMDRWYTSNNFLKTIVKERGFEALFALKSNRKLYYDGHKAQAKVYAAALSETQFDAETIGTRTYNLHSLEAKLSSGTKGTVVVSRSWYGQTESTFFLFCTDKSMTARQIVEIYRTRWGIETFYRNAKQLLGLSSYQLLHEDAILRHWLFVFMAYSFLEVQRFDRYQELLAVDPMAAQPTLGEMKREYGKLAQRLFVKSIFSLCQQGFDLQTICKRFAL
jgi:SRSO17 transposase